MLPVLKEAQGRRPPSADSPPAPGQIPDPWVLCRTPGPGHSPQWPKSHAAARTGPLSPRLGVHSGPLPLRPKVPRGARSPTAGGTMTLATLAGYRLAALP